MSLPKYVHMVVKTIANHQVSMIAQSKDMCVIVRYALTTLFSHEISLLSKAFTVQMQ